MRRRRSSFSLSLCFLSASSSSALASALACMAASVPAPPAAVAMVRPLAAASRSAASILALAICAKRVRSFLFFSLISFSCNPSAIPSNRLRCVVTSQPGGRRTPRGGAIRAATARASCSCFLAARRVRADRMASSSSAPRSSPIFFPGRLGSLPPGCSMSFSVVYRNSAPSRLYSRSLGRNGGRAAPDAIRNLYVASSGSRLVTRCR
mmetsp:Transcript_21579/g.61908  ORF Transcript_21579/g.61908 Transcript_21579/m.61908 type:complete len:208 (-) Transcript_21579:145-768(-)